MLQGFGSGGPGFESDLWPFAVCLSPSPSLYCTPSNKGQNVFTTKCSVQKPPHYQIIIAFHRQYAPQYLITTVPTTKFTKVQLHLFLLSGWASCLEGHPSVRPSKFCCLSGLRSWGQLWPRCPYPQSPPPALPQGYQGVSTPAKSHNPASMSQIAPGSPPNGTYVKYQPRRRPRHLSELPQLAPPPGLKHVG